MAAEVKLMSDPIVELGGVIMTNSVLASVLVTLLLFVFFLILRPGFQLIPSKMQLVFETLVLSFYEPLREGLGERSAKRLLPYFVTLFLFIFLANQLSFIPLVSSFVVQSLEGQISLFRTPTSDWSLPLTLALFTVLGTQIIAFFVHPWRHIGNYIRVHKFFTVRSPMDLMFAVIEFFLGLLEIVSELAKVISLSARLLGNVFAGEVMIMIIAGLFGIFTFYIVPIPFIILSAFSGLVQAYVFAYLSMQFMSMSIQTARG